MIKLEIVALNCSIKLEVLATIIAILTYQKDQLFILMDKYHSN